MLSRSLRDLVLKQNQLVRKASTNVATSISQTDLKTNNTKQEKFEKSRHLDQRPLYLDAQATSPIDPRVLDAMLPYMTNMFGNPHSRTHAYGWESEKAVEKAREVLN